MKVFIVKLNGKILTEYTNQETIVKPPECPSKTESAITSSSSIISEGSNPDEEAVFDYQKKTLLSDIIEHSRKLSLAQYDQELNYTRIRNIDCFYLARHRALFIYCSQQEDYSVLAVENILNNLVRLFEVISLNIFKNGKLPSQLNDYQREQLKKLKYKISKIIEEQNRFQFVRKESIRQEQKESEFHHLSNLTKREVKLNQISDKKIKIEEEHIKYLYQTEKKLNKYRIKICIFSLIVIVVGFISFYLLIRESELLL